MTLTDIGERLIPQISIGPGYGSSIIDAEGEKVAMVFQVPKSGTLKSVACRLTKTTTDTISYRLETVDASTGVPTGTLYAANASGSVSVNASGVWWFALNGSTGVSVTAGDIVAIVLAQGSVPGSHAVYTYDYGLYRASGAFPYALLYTGSWSKSVGAFLALEYSDSIVTPWGVTPMHSAHSTTTFKLSGSPNTIGNKLRFPFGARVVGVAVYADLDYVSEIKLYGSDGVTVLGTITTDPDLRGSASAAICYYQFSSPITILADTWYRVVLESTDDTGNISIGHLTMSTIGAYDGLSLLPHGADCIWTACVSDPEAEEDWTQTANKRVAISLILDQIDISAGGSWGGTWGG
jgi:hypothetical protein